MLTFLRKIRKSLIESGSTRRYLLYAIGEILLVMIGILLALQVNNWNQQRISEGYELNLLKELKQSIVDDYGLIEMSLDGNRRTIRSCEAILEHFDHNLPYHDSLSLHFENTNLWWTMLIRKNAYEAAKAYGLDFIEDDSTRTNLSGLYEQIQPFGQMMDERQAQYYYNTVSPILIELFESIDRHWYIPKSGNVPRDYNALKKHDTYRAILKTNIGNRSNFNEWIELSLSQMKDLEIRLQKEIEMR